MNMQLCIEDGKDYVLEANPRASRTVPLVSKVCNIRMAAIATESYGGFRGKRYDIALFPAAGFRNSAERKPCCPLTCSRSRSRSGPRDAFDREVARKWRTPSRSRISSGGSDLRPAAGYRSLWLISVSDVDKAEALKAALFFSQIVFAYSPRKDLRILQGRKKTAFYAKKSKSFTKEAPISRLHHERRNQLNINTPGSKASEFAIRKFAKSL
jgi:hypothetical protein